MQTLSVAATALRLRMIIGFLGEKRQAGWWQSDFWSPSASVFLSPIFPRTLLLAQCEGAAAAARAVHDERIGTGHVYHLFRLPEAIEQMIHQSLQHPDVIGSIGALVSDRAAAEKYLADHFSTSDEETFVGPTLVGNSNGLADPKTFRKIGSAYLSGLRRDVLVLPYLKEAE